MVNGLKYCWNLNGSSFTVFISHSEGNWSLWMQFCSKKSLFMVCKILGLFVNTLAADDQYSLLKRDDLLKHLRIQLSLKESFSLEILQTKGCWLLVFLNIKDNRIYLTSCMLTSQHMYQTSFLAVNFLNSSLTLCL